MLWLTPIVFALYVALRPIAETNKYGYVSLPHHLTLQNFADAWKQSDMWHFFLQLGLTSRCRRCIITLFLASCVRLRRVPAAASGSTSRC